MYIMYTTNLSMSLYTPSFNYTLHHSIHTTHLSMSYAQPWARSLPPGRRAPAAVRRWSLSLMLQELEVEGLGLGARAWAYEPPCPS